MRRVAVLALLGLSLGAHAGVLSDGAEAFESGDLDGAIDTWSEAVDGGAPSGRLLYDLGNAWYRKGDLPRAVACYRAAQRLRPRDGNVHHNLALARADLSGLPEPVGPLPGWTALLTVGELALGGFALTVLGSGATLAWWRRRVRAWLTAGVLLVAVGLGLSVTAWVGGSHGAVAVVVDSTVAVRDAPAAEAGARHELEPGSELRILDSLGDFHLVVDGNGRRGWVPRNGVYAPGS